MDKLPPELLHKIFFHLNLQERLGCLTICRRWWSVLDKYSLFCRIELENEGDRFNRFMDMFKRLPERAAQIEEFSIELHKDTPFNRRELFEIFPNARKMEVDHCWGEVSSLHSHFTQDIDQIHSNSKVEFLSDFYHCELVSQMVYSKLGSRLKTLCLKDMSIPDTPTILSQLKDLPVLKTLALQSAGLEIDDLELLHKNVPSIQELNLDPLYLKGSMPSEVIPASSITKLKFYGSDPEDVNTLCLIYQYMAKKYTNVTEVDFHDVGLDDYEPSERKYFYLNGYLDFLKLIGPIKDELSLEYVPNGVNPFEVLDAVDSKIQYLDLYGRESETILQDLSRSNQSKYVQALILIDAKLDSIHVIKNMTSLTELRIRCPIKDTRPVDLVSCLEACPPSLKTFAIVFDRIVVKPHNIVLKSIENLNIRCHTLTSEIGDIISSCFPNLVKLSLYFKSLQNTNITLKSPRLQHASLCRDDFHLDDDDNYGLSFQSLNQTETQHYLYDGLVWKCVQFEDIQHLLVLSFTSFTKQKLDLENGINILLC
jgi:hypothetical protein